MNSLLEKEYVKLEQQREVIVSWINSLSTGAFHEKPNPKKWSINQILSHIVSSERLAVSYVSKKRLGIATLPNTGIKEDLIMMIVVISQRLPLLKFKAPKTVAENTLLHESPEALIKNWDEVRADLKELLEKFTDDEIKRTTFKHPIAGMLNVKQGVRFLREHIIHHTPQIKRLLP